MAKGDGGISEVRRGVWRVTLSLGNDPITGKRQRVTRTVHGTKAEARKVRDKLRRDHEAGLRIDAGKMTFREFAEMWHAARVEAGEVSKGRLASERGLLRVICGILGDVAMADITPQIVKSFYAEVQARREAEGKKRYSGTTLHMMHVILNQVMREAVSLDMILRNPCERVKAPKAAKPERRSLTGEDAARLLASVGAAEAEALAKMGEKEARQFGRGNGFGRTSILGLCGLSCLMAVRIGLATGMRRGEVVGLLWDCVNVEGGSIVVKRSYTAHDGLGRPKSDAGVRTIAIDRNTVAHLWRWKERQRVELLKLGIRQCDETPVCCSDTGGIINPDNFSRWWWAFRRRVGFPDLKFHELRHTQATQLLANGVDFKTVQTRMGHASASLTLDFYAHAMPGNDEKAAELMGAILAERPKETPILEVKTA